MKYEEPMEMEYKMTDGREVLVEYTGDCSEWPRKCSAELVRVIHGDDEVSAEDMTEFEQDCLSEICADHYLEHLLGDKS